LLFPLGFLFFLETDFGDRNMKQTKMMKIPLRPVVLALSLAFSGAALGQTATWNSPTTSGTSAWETPGNWTPDTSIPDADTEVIIDGGGTESNDVEITTDDVVAKTVTISGDNGDASLTVSNGGSLQVGGADGIEVTGTASNTAALTVEEGGTLDVTNGGIEVTGASATFGGEVTTSGDITVAGDATASKEGELTLSDSANVTIGGKLDVIADDDQDASITVSNGADATLTTGSGIYLRSSANAVATLEVETGGELTVFGDIFGDEDSVISVNEGALTINTNYGSWFAGELTGDVAGTLTKEGSVA
jgi:hypothetical protein